MKEAGSLLFLYTETPLHAGSGIALGAIDLPIQRERITEHPMVQGSGIKGALREALKPETNSDLEEENLWLQLFGPELDAGAREEFAGAISLQDARLLLLPIRTLWGGFAWVTCPLVLERLARDVTIASSKAPEWIHALATEKKALSRANALVGGRCKVRERNRVVVEDFDYDAKGDSELVTQVATWLKTYAFPKSEEYGPFKESLAERLVILDDGEFRHWAKFGLEVAARIAIDSNTGTVKDGALWTEESLPSEALLWAPMFLSDGRRTSQAKKYTVQDFYDHVHKKFNANFRMRLGGDRTVGRGIVAVAPSRGGAS